MWDQRYGQPGYVFGDQPNDFLRSVAGQIQPGGTVLCLGEGQGRNAVFLAEQGFAVTAMDVSAVGMARAAELAAARGVPLITEVADLNTYRIAPQSWDAIVSIFVHLPAPLRRKIHNHVVGGLKPNGVFVLEAYTPEQLQFGTGGPSSVAVLARLAELRNELGDLTLEHAAELERDVVEGIGHTGHAAVVQILARKAGPVQP